LIAGFDYSSTQVPSIGDIVNIKNSGISQLAKNLKYRDMIKDWHGIDVKIVDRKLEFRKGEEHWYLNAIVADTFFK